MFFYYLSTSKPKQLNMKRKLFFLLMIVACIGLIIACNNNESKEPTAVTPTKEDSAKAVLTRGEYLVANIAPCLDCHSERDPMVFAMPIKPGTEGGGAAMPFGEGVGVPGEVTAPNITPYKLKDWSDEDIIKAITQGINKKGDTLFPIMPYHNYSRLAKDDIQAIVAYIRALKPIEKADVPRKLFITAAQFGPLPANTLDQNKRPDPSDKVKYGEYLVTMASCSDCHTPMTQQGPDMSKMFAGGFHFKEGPLEVTVTNITPDSATGIGTWTEAMFLAKFKTNLDQVNSKVNPGKQQTVMPWGMYATMKEDDLKAIYAYLRTVPPVKNKIEKWPTK
jgi:mono/diheme cytochrome c family protein